MSGIDEKFLEELKQKNDIVSVISEYMPLERRGRSYWGRCPFHTEKTASFSVNQDGGYYHCFGCSAGGDVIRFVMQYDGVEFYDAVKKLAERAKMPLPALSYDDKQQKEERALKERILNCLKATETFYKDNLFSERGVEHLRYLARRGLTVETIKEFQLGASLDFESLPKYLLKKGFTFEDMYAAKVVTERKENGKYFDAFANRLMFPIHNNYGEVIAFGGRNLNGDEYGKYRNSQEIPSVFVKSRALYNINRVRDRRSDKQPYVILVEGYMDVIKVYQSGFTATVASMGTSLTKEQAHILKRYTDRVLLSYDGDSAGQKATIRGLELLESEGLSVGVVSLPDNLDPDELIEQRGKAAFLEALDSALPLVDFKLAILKKTFPPITTEGRRKYVATSLKVIREVESAAVREELLKKLRDESGISYDALNRDLELAPKERVVRAPLIIKSQVESAERFVLYAFLNKKPFTVGVDLSELPFTRPLHRKIKSYVLSRERDGKDIMISMLFEAVGEGDEQALGELLPEEAYNVNPAVEETYFKDCVKVLIKERIDREIDDLREAIDNADDIAIKKTLTAQLSNKILERSKL